MGLMLRELVGTAIRLVMLGNSMSSILSQGLRKSTWKRSTGIPSGTAEDPKYSIEAC
jgi:hypothetical protein